MSLKGAARSHSCMWTVHGRHAALLGLGGTQVAVCIRASGVPLGACLGDEPSSSLNVSFLRGGGGTLLVMSIAPCCRAQNSDKRRPSGTRAYVSELALHGKPVDGRSAAALC